MCGCKYTRRIKVSRAPHLPSDARLFPVCSYLNGDAEKPMAQSFILLVEDNPDDVFLASRIIGKVCDDEILVARDGEEASELLRRMEIDGSHHQIRLVLLDLKLPKISGLDILQFIRGSERLCLLAVAILTSSDNETDQERCRELGVEDYIYKPMTADRLKRVLSRGGGGVHE